jgi:hypothetical protein
VKAVADTLGVARSNLVEQLQQPERPRRGPYRRAEDEAVLAEIRAITDARPTYGYRRVTALLETAVEGIASNRHHPQPGMHCSWCQFKNECKAWLPGMTLEDIHRKHAA